MSSWFQLMPQTLQIADYCRDIETYLCQKNDGHLIRIVGPSFELVSHWAADGIPLKVACRGIDRYFERYYRKGARRRPVRIDFCGADVQDAFDEWRRAVGLVTREGSSTAEAAGAAAPAGRRPSLAAHLSRVLLRLTDARTAGTLGPDADEVLDRISRELDVARAAARGLRGEARQAVIERLNDLDRDLLRAARSALSVTDEHALEREACDELAGFRDSMPDEAYARAREAAIERLMRERLRLPTLLFEQP